MDRKLIFPKAIVIKIFCIVMVSFFTAVILNGIRTENVKNCVKDYLFGRGQEMQEKVIDFSEDNLLEREQDGLEIISDGDKLSVMLTAWNDYVQEITLNFRKQRQNDLYLEVFYVPNEGEEFSDARRYMFGISHEKETITLNIRKKVWNLRIDFMNEENLEDFLDTIVLNQEAVPFSIGRLFSSLFEFSSIWLDRVIIISFIGIFIGVCICFNTKKIFSVLFQYRWLVAGALLLFFVVNRYNGDSLTMYDVYIQHGEGNEYIEPVIGKARAIRSDEWMVSAPINLSTQFLDDPYGTYNNILRATDTVNSNKMSFRSLVNPIYSIGVLLREVFGFDYQYSFTWYAPTFLMFLLTLELFLIISKQNKALSLAGTGMVVLSSYYLWWGLPVELLYAHGALVCAYHFFYVKTVRSQILLGYGTAVFTALFMLTLYPAWQVPIAYTVLAILVWMIHENWDRIKNSTKLEIIIIIISLLFCMGIVLSDLLGRREYLSSITETIYPGKRVDTGSFTVNKLFNYCSALLFSFKDTGNPSEAGVCISFFPIPTMIAAWMWIKNKKKDWLTAGLLIVSVLLLTYTTTGIPLILAKCTLMTYSTAARAVDILGYIQVLLFVQIFSLYDGKKRFSKMAAAGFSILMSIVTIVSAQKNLPGYMPKIYMGLIGIVIAVIMFMMMYSVSKKTCQQMYTVIIIISLITGIYVRPIEKGTEAIYSKPLAKEIQKIVKNDSQSKWLAVGGVVLPSFTVACGARTVNFVNTYPNMELWKKLDHMDKYDEVYNRYAHINLELVEEETSMELLHPDCMTLRLSYQDIILTDAKYISSTSRLEADNEYVTLVERYSEAGSYIYEIQYH